MASSESNAEHHGEHGGKMSRGFHGAGGGHEEAHEGAPEWLISFADNIALLMGFFVILLAMNIKEPTTGGIGGKDQNGSNIDPKVLDMIISIREAFHNPVSPNSTNPREALLVQRILQRKEGTSKTEGPPGDKQDVQSIRPTDYHRLGGFVVFEESSAQVDADGRTVAAAVARELKGRRSIVEVRGHTSLVEASQSDDRGMALAFQRGLEVARVLRDEGVEWDRVRVIACGAGDRVKPLARSPKEHHNNQRVEIIVTDEQLPADPYAMDPSPAGRRDPLASAPTE